MLVCHCNKKCDKSEYFCTAYNYNHYHETLHTAACTNLICKSCGSLRVDKKPLHSKAVNCFHQLALYGDLVR